MFSIFVIFTPKIGQDSHFDYVVIFYQKGLVQPPTRFWVQQKWYLDLSNLDFNLRHRKVFVTCWYFAESLVDRLNDDRPIGLIHTAWGGRTLDHLVNQGPNIWDTTLMATRNPVNSPVELGSISHYLKGFIHPRWCRISEPSTLSRKDGLGDEGWQHGFVEKWWTYFRYLGKDGWWERREDKWICGNCENERKRCA